MYGISYANCSTHELKVWGQRFTKKQCQIRYDTSMKPQKGLYHELNFVQGGVM